MRVYSVEQIREYDRILIEDFNLPSHSLMEVAGHKIFEQIKRRFPGIQSVFILLGKGNNGGDGVVVARLLLLSGVNVTLLLTSDIESSSKDFIKNFEILSQIARDVKNCKILKYGIDDIDFITDEIIKSDLIIDALLGTGIKSELKSPYKEIIHYINSLGVQNKVVAIDIPSGLNGDSGSPMPDAIKSALTITIGGGKTGLFSYPAPLYTQEVEVVDIGLPLIKDIKPVYEISDSLMYRGRVLRSDINFHKGSGGHVGVVAGSTDRPGASFLSVLGALSIGAGLVTLISERDVINRLPILYPEAMVREVDYQKSDDEYFDKLFSGIDTLVIGPGLSRKDGAVLFTKRLITYWKKKMILDAEALNIILDIKFQSDKVVITPHPTELSRIIGISKDEIQRDRVGYAVKCASEHNCIVVLKGARSIIAHPNGDLTINMSGNPFMASGGMGDLLSGIIGGLLHQTDSVYDAARIGAYIHGLAADIAISDNRSPLLSRDVASYIKKAVQIAKIYG
ncbi:MAG: NAD(P)H-hydrate dehydratase [Myxococcota bacterium]